MNYFDKTLLIGVCLFIGIVSADAQTTAEDHNTKTSVSDGFMPFGDRYMVDVRTNLFNDAFLLPTVGVEWRACRTASIKLDAGFSYWGDGRRRTQKIFAISPEVRWYTPWVDNMYLGLGANYAKYNIYRSAIGSVFSKDTGYQGRMWSLGVTVGYVLHLYEGLHLDFNLGLGYNNSKYDSFTMVNELRTYKERAKSKSLWGPTQLGVTLFWRFEGRK